MSKKEEARKKEIRKKVRKVTSGKEWRGERDKPEELPSGKVVLLNKIRLRDFLTRGEIPNPLMPVVMEMMAGKTWTPTTEKDLKLYFDLLDFVCVIGLKQPKIVENPEADDEISIEDVDFEDQLHVFNKAQQEIRFFIPFRPKPGGHVEASHSGQDLPVQAEPDDGSDG